MTTIQSKRAGAGGRRRSRRLGSSSVSVTQSPSSTATSADRVVTQHGAAIIGPPVRHSDSISFSTRSSRLLNGSLHSTVRCAWSLSLRCTQSTV